MAAVTAAVIGAGLRGRFTYGGYALSHPERLRIVALAEPEDGRRSEMAKAHGLPAERVFRDWKALLDRPRLADAAIVATGDALHVEPSLAALGTGYHVLLEKPMAPEPRDCLRVVEAAEGAGRILQIGHVLRFAPFYREVHEILRSGRLGAPVHIDMKEHVAHWHMTHSYVRGKFRKRSLAAPIVLAKCCHDLDLLAWFAGGPAARVASFGSLTHYRSERAPEGAPERCTEGCPVQADCPHDAVRFYLDPDPSLARAWPWSDVSADPARAARRRALETGRYGRCVYRCDNDVVDHQVLAVEFEGGATASFALHGHATHERRTLRVSGSEGELRGVLHDGVIELTRHGSLEVERRRVEESALGHFGGDEGLLDHFVDCVAREAIDDVQASGRASLESHWIGFAAEQARLRSQVVELRSFREALGRGSAAS